MSGGSRIATMASIVALSVYVTDTAQDVVLLFVYFLLASGAIAILELLTFCLRKAFGK